MTTAESTESTSSPREKTRRRASGSRGRPRFWFVAAIVVGLLVLAGGGWAVWTFLLSGDNERLPADAGIYSTKSLTEALVDREADPRELTEQELFERGGEELSSQGFTFTLDDSEILEDCAGAVWGERPTDALGATDCTQVARAAYSADEHIATVNLFNLADVESAEAFAEALEPAGGEDDGFLTVMDSDAVADLGSGYSTSEITVQGHYLMVTWVQDRSSTDPEERDSLAKPLRTLANFDMALFRRLLEHEPVDGAEEDAEGADEADGEGATDPEGQAEEPAGEQGEQPEEVPAE